VQSASARKEAKLRVWNLALFHTPISHQIFQHVGENTINYIQVGVQFFDGILHRSRQDLFIARLKTN